MSDAIDCPRCGNKAFPASPLSSIQEYLCASCTNRFDVRVHGLPDPRRPPAKVFKVLVDAHVHATAKLRLKLERALRGLQEFSLHDLEKQALAGDEVWKIGIFNEKGLMEVTRRLAAAGLEFRLVQV